ncbi:MAG: hypothetical protein Q8L98_04650 [Chlamydiales bacterium]|nr:hypothetical protein [Chlamydiales bacterium]
MMEIAPIKSNNNFTLLESAEINLSLCRKKEISKKIFFETNPYEIISDRDKEKCTHLIEEINLLAERVLRKNSKLEKSYKKYFNECKKKIQELNILEKSQTCVSSIPESTINSLTIEKIKNLLLHSKNKYLFIAQNEKKLNELINKIITRNITLKQEVKYLKKLCKNKSVQIAEKIEQTLAEAEISKLSSEISALSSGILKRDLFAGLGVLALTFIASR